MPVHRAGKNCHQWGGHGHVYCGPGSAEKAARQGRAAFAHGYEGHARHAEEAQSIADQLDHPDLRRVWDTDNLRDGDEVDSVGMMKGRDLVTYHVTDRPEKAQRDVLRRPRLMAAYGPRGASAELGPGLYVSAVPGLWIARARGKWEFLRNLTETEIMCLGKALEREVREQRKDRYISEPELERALRDLGYALAGVDEGMRYYPQPDILVFLAGQPYNIPFWKPEWLSRCGIRGSSKPKALQLRLRGTFAELGRSRPDPRLLRTLRRLGVSGAFTPAGMTTNPELVVWDPESIVESKIVEV